MNETEESPFFKLSPERQKFYLDVFAGMVTELGLKCSYDEKEILETLKIMGISTGEIVSGRKGHGYTLLAQRFGDRIWFIVYWSGFEDEKKNGHELISIEVHKFAALIKSKAALVSEITKCIAFTLGLDGDTVYREFIDQLRAERN